MSTAPVPRKMSQKKQLQVLEHRIHCLKDILSKTKRYVTTLMPWEEIVRALKEDTLEQVRHNRSLKREVEENKKLYELLTVWIHSMSVNVSPSLSLKETWKHSHLPNTGEESRRIAQNWIVQQTYHNTERALQQFPFTQDWDTTIDVNVSFSLDEEAFEINCMTQQIVCHPLEIVSDACWIGEITFTSFRRTKALPTDKFIQELCSKDVHYDCELEPNAAGKQIRMNSLHGQIRNTNNTTIVGRTIIHDEAFPMNNLQGWTIGVKQWDVADRIDQNTTRLRTFFTMDHPQSMNKLVPMEQIAEIFQLAYDDSFHVGLRKMISRIQRLQRERSMAYLDCILDHLVATQCTPIA